VLSGALNLNAFRLPPSSSATATTTTITTTTTTTATTAATTTTTTTATTAATTTTTTTTTTAYRSSFSVFDAVGYHVFPKQRRGSIFAHFFGSEIKYDAG